MHIMYNYAYACMLVRMYKAFMHIIMYVRTVCIMYVLYVYVDVPYAYIYTSTTVVG